MALGTAGERGYYVHSVTLGSSLKTDGHVITCREGLNFDSAKEKKIAFKGDDGRIYAWTKVVDSMDVVELAVPTQYYMTLAKDLAGSQFLSDAEGCFVVVLEKSPGLPDRIRRAPCSLMAEEELVENLLGKYKIKAECDERLSEVA